MDWIRDFQLFLFDFDGLLVNTEHVQFQAYINMMAKRGYDLGWSFTKFCELAHLNSSAMKEAIYTQFPDLDPNWELLRAEKIEQYNQLLRVGKVELMPGVERLLKALKEKDIRRCVVTNSSLDQVEAIRSQLSVLKTLPHWITREDYEKPKPSPEGYLKAIAMYGKKGDRIIGFEDSVRGLTALKQTPALPVLICPAHHPLLEIALEDGGLHFESFNHISDYTLRSQL